MSNEFSGGIESLEVWKVARAFRNHISDLVNSFNEEEKYLLRFQLLKSTRAASSAIAEGYGRYQINERVHYCRIARGHLVEALDSLYIAVDEKYISDHTFNLYKKEYDHLIKLLNGYIGYLKKNEDPVMDDMDMIMEDGARYGEERDDGVE